jgi:hypothetical protein
VSRPGRGIDFGNERGHDLGGCGQSGGPFASVVRDGGGYWSMLTALGQDHYRLSAGSAFHRREPDDDMRSLWPCVRDQGNALASIVSTIFRPSEGSVLIS